jgi:hypothetical protein
MQQGRTHRQAQHTSPYSLISPPPPQKHGTTPVNTSSVAASNWLLASFKSSTNASPPPPRPPKHHPHPPTPAPHTCQHLQSCRVKVVTGLIQQQHNGRHQCNTPMPPPPPCPAPSPSRTPPCPTHLSAPPVLQRQGGYWPHPAAVRWQAPGQTLPEPHEPSHHHSSCQWSAAAARSSRSSRHNSSMKANLFTNANTHIWMVWHRGSAVTAAAPSLLCNPPTHPTSPPPGHPHNAA